MRLKWNTSYKSNIINKHNEEKEKNKEQEKSTISVSVVPPLLVRKMIVQWRTYTCLAEVLQSTSW